LQNNGQKWLSDGGVLNIQDGGQKVFDENGKTVTTSKWQYNN